MAWAARSLPRAPMSKIRRIHGSNLDWLRELIDGIEAQTEVEGPVTAYELIVERRVPGSEDEDGQATYRNTSWRDWENRPDLIATLFLELLNVGVRQMSPTPLREKLQADE